MFDQWRVLPEQRAGLRGWAWGRTRAWSPGWFAVFVCVRSRAPDMADSAVSMGDVVPTHDVHRPSSGVVHAVEALGRELRVVLDGAEQRLGIGAVVADTGPRVRRLDAQPVHMACTVVAVKVEPLSPRRTGLVSMAAMRSASTVLRTMCDAWSASSLMCTSTPTILRL